MKGIVYILTNDAMPDYIKIGMTTNDVQQRMRELDNTSIPLPFRAHFAMEFSDYKQIESLLHTAFDHFRARKNREFFEMQPEQAVQMLSQLAPMLDGKEIRLSDDAIDAEGQVVENKSTRTQRFRFEDCEIPVGSQLHFSKDESITCTVISSKKVRYNEQEYSLSALSLELLHEMGYRWASARGAAFWVFDGELLLERQKRLEAQSAED